MLPSVSSTRCKSIESDPIDSRRQSSLAAQDPQEGEMLDLLEQVADTDGWGLVKE